MKKRSLIVSIVMLLVSAITMTSSTYAWFAMGTTAKISGIEATIINDNGTLGLSAWEDGDFKPTLSKSDFYSHPDYDKVSPNGYFADELYPTSLVFYESYGDTVWDCVTGSFIQDTNPDSPTYCEMIFKTFECGDGWPLTFFPFYAKATMDCTVKVSPSFGTTNVSYVYAFVHCAKINPDSEDIEWIEDGIFYSAIEGRSYYPLVRKAPDGIDSNHNGIMDSGDKALNNIDPYTGVSTGKNVATNKPFQMEFKANELYGFEFIIWAEGQDPACCGPVSDGFVQFSVDFEVVE